MACAAIAAAAVAELAALALGPGHEVGQGANVLALGGLGIHHQHIGNARHLRDGSKVFLCVVGQAFEQPGVDGIGGHRRNAHRQTIARGARNRTHANAAARAGAVFDHDGAQLGLQLFSDAAHAHIDGATGGVGNDDAQRAFAAGDLRLRDGGKRQRAQAHGGASDQLSALHSKSPDGRVSVQDPCPASPRLVRALNTSYQAISAKSQRAAATPEDKKGAAGACHISLSACFNAENQ